jgi:hypothetical protein
MSTIALMSGADTLESQIVALAESEPHKAFLISLKLAKIADRLKKEYQSSAVDFWHTNKELPAGYTCKESSTGKKFAFTEDTEWQIIKAKLDAREALLERSSTAPAGIYTFDAGGEAVPKVSVTEGSKYTFTQK